MTQYGINTTLDYLRRIATEHHASAKEIVRTLPVGWQNAMPAPCRQPDGAVPWKAITHALLALIDPVKFPPSRRTRRLAGFIDSLLDTNERVPHHQS
jgi:hypothetical protein